MIPVLTAEDIRKLDQATISSQQLSSHELMERAAEACVSWLIKNLSDENAYAVFAGHGNNGGDGLAIARLLRKEGKKCDVFIIDETGKETVDFIENRKLLGEEAVSEITDVHTLVDLPPGTIIIDAIFGTGLNRPAEGLAAKVIRWLNAAAQKIISIDIPSGLAADVYHGKEAAVIQASVTLSFQYYKRSFLLPETGIYTGHTEILDINLAEDTNILTRSRFYLIEKADIRSWIKPRKPFAHKGNFGHALLLAGSYGKCGAAALSCAAALRTGAGLVTARVPSCCYIPLQGSEPELMVMPDENPAHLAEVLKLPDVDAIGAGCGLGTDAETGNVIKRLIQDYKGPLVLDADALNILAENKTWLSFMHPGVILTPHQGEFRRIAGEYNDPFERQSAQLAFALKYSCYLLLKGRFSALACPDGTMLINPTGNPSMATAGSGDVLTGIITALLAQGLKPMQAAATGMYLHGLAGDLAAAKNQSTIIARDIIAHIPEAIHIVQND